MKLTIIRPTDSYDPLAVLPVKFGCNVRAFLRDRSFDPSEFEQAALTSNAYFWSDRDAMVFDDNAYHHLHDFEWSGADPTNAILVTTWRMQTPLAGLKWAPV